MKITASLFASALLVTIGYVGMAKAAPAPGACYNGIGIDYRGTYSLTTRGQCDNWNDVDDMIPADGGEHNYCRNPDKDPRGPWCYIDMWDWEYCKMEQCTNDGNGGDDDGDDGDAGGEDDCNEELSGYLDEDYRGCQTVTRSGRTCQAWSSQSPHRHPILQRYPDSGLENNYCRNPDGEDTIWCYTTDSDKRWEYCDPLPKDGNDGNGGDAGDAGDGDNGDDGNAGGDNDKCYNGIGADYRGTHSLTKRGLTCSTWNDWDEEIPADGGAHNFCRNPNNDPQGPWCYVESGGSAWDYCDMEPCTNKCYNGIGADYRGTHSLTKRGHTCGTWNDWDEEIPADGGDHKFCRNPTNDPQGPWCYVDSGESAWDYCDMEPCTILDCSDELPCNNGGTCNEDGSCTCPEGYSGRFCETDNIGCYTGDGYEYQGEAKNGNNGKVCQTWNTNYHFNLVAYDDDDDWNYTHEDNFDEIVNFEYDHDDDGNQIPHNFCRNPTHDVNGPWCFTEPGDLDNDRHTKKREDYIVYCDVPKCP